MFLLSTVEVDVDGTHNSQVCDPTRRQGIAKQTYSIREGHTVEIHCNIESLTWNDTSISWLHTYPALDGKLSDPVVDNSTLELPTVEINDSGDYTCLVESDGSVVLQYTITLNVFRKYFTVLESLSEK